MFAVVPASGRSGLAPLAAPQVLPDPESVSGQRRGPVWCSGRPAPAARAAPRWEGLAARAPFWLQVGGLFRELGALVRGRRGEQGPPRARRAQTPGSGPQRSSPGPKPTPVGFLIAQDGVGCWAVTGTPTRNHQRQPPLQHRAGPPFALGGGRGRRRQQGNPPGPGRTPMELGAPWSLCPHSRAWPSTCSEGWGRKGHPWACLVTAPHQPGEGCSFLKVSARKDATGALIFKMEKKMQESCTVFFLSRLLFYIEQKERKAGRRGGRRPASASPEVEVSARAPGAVWRVSEALPARGRLY